jgi:GT2 family glycosyltransferase
VALATQGFVESVTRHRARGWARDPLDPARRVRIRATAPDGTLLAEALADIYRGDVAAAGLGDGNCGFVLDLSPHAATLAGTPVTLTDADTATQLHGSPAPAADPPSLPRFLARWAEIPPATQSRLARMMTHRATGAVSVLATTRTGLPRLIASLQAQLCDRWELLLPPGTKAPTPDPRLRETPSGTNPLSQARHPLALFATAPLALEPDAIWHLLQAARDPAAYFFLWDHLQTAGTATEPVCRPAFSLDEYRSHPTLAGAFAVRTQAARALGWTGDEPDFILRMAETGAAFAHIPRLLHRTAAPPRPAAKALPALRRHLARTIPGATIAPGPTIHFPPATGRTLVVIPTRNQAPLLRACLDSLLRTRADTPLDIVVIDHESDDPDTRAYLQRIAGLVTIMPYAGPFHFARMNNLAVARHGAGAETILFLNNDTEALAPFWLARLRSLAVRPDVGAAGALLLYGDGRVQHAGVVLGFDGTATHAHAHARAFLPDGTRNPGHQGQLTALREVSAVTAACMITRREVFESVGGFDEALPIGFNDTDYCLRLRARGWRILQDGQTLLHHHESRSRKPAGIWLHPEDNALFRTRHAALIAAGDPFYNPNLRLDVQDHELRPDCLPGGIPRITRPAATAPRAAAASPAPPPGAAPAAAARTRSAAPRRRRSSG